MVYYELRITRHNGPNLDKQTHRLSTADEVLAALGRTKPSEPTLFEVSCQEGPLIFLMANDQALHMSIWIDEESYYYLCNENPGHNKYTDIGWDCFPSWTVTHDWHAALRAASIYLKTRELDQSLLWHHETA